MKITTCLSCLPSRAEEPDKGQAGASAGRTYERRAQRHREDQEAKVAADQAWRERAKAERPVLGRLASALTPKARVEPEPSHVRSWGQGAPGERRVGEVLDGLPSVTALHDRKVPGGRANIDHVAVAAAGVFVIDAKRYLDKSVERRDVGGWFRPDDRLYVGGRDRTALVDAMSWQVEAVRAALGDRAAGITVEGVLCFVESTWGWFAKPFELKGVTVCWPLAVEGVLSRPGPLDSQMRDSLARHLATRLPPA